MAIAEEQLLAYNARELNRFIATRSTNSETCLEGSLADFRRQQIR